MKVTSTETTQLVYKNDKSFVCLKSMLDKIILSEEIFLVNAFIFLLHYMQMMMMSPLGGRGLQRMRLWNKIVCYKLGMI